MLDTCIKITIFWTLKVSIACNLCYSSVQAFRSSLVQVKHRVHFSLLYKLLTFNFQKAHNAFLII